MLFSYLYKKQEKPESFKLDDSLKSKEPLVTITVHENLKKELKPLPVTTTKEQIAVAIQELNDAMVENLDAGNAVIKSEKRKITAHYNYIKAKERLYSLEKEIIA